MKASSIRASKVVSYAAVPVAVLLAGVFVWQGSQAAFTDTTRNSGNAWSSGSVTLSDDDSGQAAFTANNILPGDTGTKCIVVTSNSTNPGEVRTYVENLTTGGKGLADYLLIDVETGTGGSFNDCTGFEPDAGGDAIPPTSLTVLAENYNSFATGGTSWETSGTAGEQRTYRVTWTFDTTGLTQDQINAMQGGKVSADMVWELQTN